MLGSFAIGAFAHIRLFCSRSFCMLGSFAQQKLPAKEPNIFIFSTKKKRKEK